jgi:hypothetical protein
MRGFDWVDHFENTNNRIAKMPWDLKKVRIVYELQKLGMTTFEIQAELEGVTTKREVLSILNRIKIYLKTGRLHGVSKNYGQGSRV